MGNVGLDIAALIRALLIGVAGGLVVAGIAAMLTGPRERRKATFGMLGGGVALGVTIVLFFTWPSLVETPHLAGFSRAEAELALEKLGLLPETRPGHHAATEVGRVIADSQEPAGGIKVRRGTVVRFGVAVGTHQVESEEDTAASVTLFNPRSGEQVRCRRYADGVHRFTVSGTCGGASGELRLLLWIKPINSPSETPGWYLQRRPVNGITAARSDGSWEGIAQIGNAQWPPHEGDVLDLVVTVVKPETAERLLAAPGVVTLMSLPGIASDRASDVKVTLR